MSYPLTTSAAYSKRMLGAIDFSNIQGVKTGFASFFGRGLGRTIDCRNDGAFVYETIKGNNRIAPMIKRGDVSTQNISATVDTTGKYTQYTGNFPLIEKQGTVAYDQAWKKPFGESEYAPVNKQARLANYAQRIHHGHYISIAQRLEYCAAQAILTGKHPFITGSVEGEMDFLRDASLTDPVAKDWADPTSTPREDIQTLYRAVKTISGIAPNVIVMTLAGFTLFLKHASIVADINKDYIQWVNLQPGAGTVPADIAFLTSNPDWNLQGFMRLDDGPTLPILTCDEDYIESDGSRVKYMADDLVLIGNTNSILDKYVGPRDGWDVSSIERAMYRERFGIDLAMSMPTEGMFPTLNGSIFPEGLFYCDAEFPNSKVCILRTQSSVVYAPTQVDAWGTLTGVVDLGN